jgi:hypothetical protein
MTTWLRWSARAEKLGRLEEASRRITKSVEILVMQRSGRQTAGLGEFARGRWADLAAAAFSCDFGAKVTR